MLARILPTASQHSEKSAISSELSIPIETYSSSLSSSDRNGEMASSRLPMAVSHSGE